MWIAVAFVVGVIVGVFGAYYANTYAGDGPWD